MNILEIIILTTLIFLLAASIMVIYYYIMQEVLYAEEAKKYGKIEGKIINKDTEVAMTTVPFSPYNYYFIIENEEEDGRVLRRKLYVSEEEYKIFDLKDNIKKDFFKPIIKTN